jgi:hypothetical protein
VNLPHVTKIGGINGINDADEINAFRDCIALVTVRFPEAVKIIVNAFNNCIVLVTVDIPQVTEIYNFYDENNSAAGTYTFADSSWTFASATAP